MPLMAKHSTRIDTCSSSSNHNFQTFLFVIFILSYYNIISNFIFAIIRDAFGRNCFISENDRLRDSIIKI